MSMNKINTHTHSNTVPLSFVNTGRSSMNAGTTAIDMNTKNAHTLMEQKKRDENEGTHRWCELVCVCVREGDRVLTKREWKWNLRHKVWVWVCVRESETRSEKPPCTCACERSSWRYMVPKVTQSIRYMPKRTQTMPVNECVCVCVCENIEQQKNMADTYLDLHVFANIDVKICVCKKESEGKQRYLRTTQRGILWVCSRTYVSHY